VSAKAPVKAPEKRGQLHPLRRLEGRSAEMSDEALVAAAATGDAAAMAALFDRFHASLHAFVARLARPADVDDLVHATFLEAFAVAGKYRGGSLVRTWLFGIALNVSRHHFRSESRRRTFLTALEPPAPADAARPDRTAESRQLVERVRAALAHLSHERRAAFLLCEVEELSGPEAAKALGAPVGTVGRWLFEARMAVREALEEPR
jgi:RNA polymerase sigma-70 factor (ECF subfamily)